MNKLYYGGVLLPEIPVGALYHFIRNNATTGYYELYCSSGIPYYNGGTVQFANTEARARYRIAIASAETAEEWEDNGTSTANVTIDTNRPLLWSSHDIPNGSATSTIIYHAASCPLTEEHFKTLISSTEAESGVLTGSATVADRASYSKNVVVDSITSSNGTLTLNFEAPVEGYYEMKMFFTHSGTRGFKYTLNGKTYLMSVVGTSYYAIESIGFQIYLLAGSNSIVFSGNSTTYAPMFDYFELYQIINKLPNYVLYGTAELSTTVIQKITAAKTSYISWEADLPEGTSLRIYSKLSAGEYALCEREGSIAGITDGADLSKETLYLKIEMTTEDPLVTPALLGLQIQLQDLLDVNTIVLAFDPGVTHSVQRAVGDITIAYDGSGSLMGHGGPVLAFEKIFTPVDLVPKNNPYDPEHIEVSNITAEGSIMRVYHSYTKEDEHISVSEISAVGSLIDIDNI